MSRSFHTTRRDLENEKGRSHRSEEERMRSLQKLRDELGKKRRTKRFVRYHRKGSWAEAGHTPIDLIPIERDDSSEFLHYPADEDDLRELMQRLPAGMLDGLERICLRLGAERQSCSREPWECHPEADPHLGRFGYEILPGVFVGSCLGVYYGARNEIHLHGIVYPPELADREMWEAYLRLRMLMTFVHELGHHYDLMFRLARGRWRADNRSNAEIYAERIEHQWLNDYVIPFLSEKYPEQFQRLENWIVTHVGIKIPMTLLAGDPRSTGKNGGTRYLSLFDTAAAFCDFVGNCHKGMDLVEARLEYADDLHMAEEYDVAMQIVELVLADKPEHVAALTLKAEIFNHCEKHEDAVPLARQALAIDPKHVGALRELMDAYEEMERWPEVIDVAEMILSLVSNPKDTDCAWALVSKGRACWELGRREEAEAIAVQLENGHRGMQRLARRLRTYFSDDEDAT